MKIIHASYEIKDLPPADDILRRVEEAGRVCYKSEDKITGESAGAFVRGIVRRGHESVLEHVGISVRFIVDRGVSHELVRHRIASFSQESTRYCNYSGERFGGEITVVQPPFLEPGTQPFRLWAQACEMAETAYFGLLGMGLSPQEARGVLPNSLKTEIVMTANLREWRHFLRLRIDPAAHPQMREVTVPLLEELKDRVPIVFDDIGGEAQT